jgi:peptidoglycan/xylan/chitin deacetylase (PgdA/CDA1 family)
LVLWSFDSFDFKLPADQLQARLKAYTPEPGDIVLFHDDMATTWQTLDIILPAWRAAGFALQAVGA